MKAVVVEKYGDPDVLTLVDIPAPHAGPGEVRIRVHAAAVNPADRMFRAGDLDAALTSDVPRPVRPGMDVAGVIDQVGVGTDTNLRRGDRVMAMVNPIGKSGGAYAEYVVQAQWLWSHHLAAGHGLDDVRQEVVAHRGITLPVGVPHVLHVLRRELLGEFRVAGQDRLDDVEVCPVDPFVLRGLIDPQPRLDAPSSLPATWRRG